MYPITQCSPQAAAKIKEVDNPSPAFKNNHHATKYHLDMLEVGQCFCIPISEAKESSIRLTTTRAAKKSNKKFTVIVHRDFGVYEVARIG